MYISVSLTAKSQRELTLCQDIQGSRQANTNTISTSHHGPKIGHVTFHRLDFLTKFFVSFLRQGLM